jgi:hypothetical protein
MLLVACAKQDPVVQDPLDYLRVGVDPKAEADAITRELGRNGFTLGLRFEEPGYVALDAVRGPDAIVRVISSRGVVLSVQAPDVRWPERLSVELAPGPRPDFNRDGQADVLVRLRERDRTCLGWVEVDSEGFAIEVFRPRPEWGEDPCVVKIDPAGPGLLLEVSVPGTQPLDARVRMPLAAHGRRWSIDESAEGEERWKREVEAREKARMAAEVRGDTATVSRLRQELDWLDQLRNAEAPVLEPADDGEKAR